MIIAMIGAAATPLIAALQNSAFLGSREVLFSSMRRCRLSSPLDQAVPKLLLPKV
jgi:hypothetical protein